MRRDDWVLAGIAVVGASFAFGYSASANGVGSQMAVAPVIAWAVAALAVAGMVVAWVLRNRRSANSSPTVDFFGWTISAWTAATIFLGLPLAAWLFWGLEGVSLLQAHWGGSNGTGPTIGEVGDIFGGINALFSVYAFLAVALAAYYQNASLRVAKHLQSQQTFEPLFFHLLERHRSFVLRDLSVDTEIPLPEASPKFQKQRDARQLKFEPPPKGERFRTVSLDGFLQYVMERWAGTVNVDKLQNATQKERRALVGEIYDRPYTRNEDIFGPYFRSLFHVFKLIDRSGLAKERRIHYANIARATLSADEVMLMVIDCATELGEEFHPLVEKYGLLKHNRMLTQRAMESNERYAAGYALFPEIAIHCYGKTAFMGADEREQYWNTHPDERPDGM